MFNRLKQIAAAAFFGLLASVSPAAANGEPDAFGAVADWQGFYAGLSVGRGSAEVESGLSLSDVSKGVFAGYMTDFGRAVVGIESDHVRIDDLELWRGKVRFGASFGSFLPYLLIGKVQAVSSSEKLNVSARGTTYGLGLGYRISERIGT